MSTKNRSAITGRYVTKEFAKRNPRTTVKESEGRKSKKKRKDR